LILNDFEQYIQNNLPKVESFHPYFNDALSSMLLAGGKRFRPLLLLDVVDSFEPLLVKNSFDVAYAIECLHTYSLIHDDLPSMDDASLRRGKPTLHVTYDEVTAVLAGDALNTYAFYLISKAPLNDSIKVKLTQELSKNGGIDGMIIGQAVDCHFENQKLDIEQLKFLHLHKTGKLIASSLKMGAIIVGDENLANFLCELGLKIGLLFQIQDDIIDVTQSSEQAGKTTNNDTSKNSFVNLLGLKKAKGEKEKLINEIKKDLETLDNKKLKQKLENTLKKYF
jgi:farnesyl diphosphate synthase